jgi:hypothetical protein
VSGLLVSEATIEGKKVNVIFDSGAPGLVLNSKYYATDQPNSFDEYVGINGSFNCQSRMVKNWSWMDAKYKHTSAILSDLSFLEGGLNEEIHALVGLSVFSDYYVSLDFDRMTVTLSKKIDLDKQDILRFQYIDQLPVITCQINGEKKYLGSIPDLKSIICFPSALKRNLRCCITRHRSWWLEQKINKT